MSTHIDTDAPLIGDLVSATFDDLESAEDAARALIAEGFTRDRFSVLIGEDHRAIEVEPLAGEDGHVLRQSVALDQESKALKGVGLGSAIGGTLGAVVAAIAAAGTTLAIPPLGIIVAGPLAAAVAGAGAGGAAGTVVGGLTGAGMSELRARECEREIRDGRILFGVQTATLPEAKLVRESLERHGGTLIED